jgi:hypothetical protein
MHLFGAESVMAMARRMPFLCVQKPYARILESGTTQRAIGQSVDPLEAYNRILLSMS